MTSFLLRYFMLCTKNVYLYQMHTFFRGTFVRNKNCIFIERTYFLLRYFSLKEKLYIYRKDIFYGHTLLNSRTVRSVQFFVHLREPVTRKSP